MIKRDELGVEPDFGSTPSSACILLFFFNKKSLTLIYSK